MYSSTKVVQLYTAVDRGRLNTVCVESGEAAGSRRAAGALGDAMTEYALYRLRYRSIRTALHMEVDERSIHDTDIQIYSYGEKKHQTARRSDVRAAFKEPRSVTSPLSSVAA